MRSTRTGQREDESERARVSTARAPAQGLFSPCTASAQSEAQRDRRTEQQIDRQTEDLIVTADAGSGREDADEADPTARIASGWWTRASGYTLQSTSSCSAPHFEHQDDTTTSLDVSMPPTVGGPKYTHKNGTQSAIVNVPEDKVRVAVSTHLTTRRGHQSAVQREP